MPSILLWEIGKQCRTRSDATERGVKSGSALLAYIIYIQNLNEIETDYPSALKLKMNFPNL